MFDEPKPNGRANKARTGRRCSSSRSSCGAAPGPSPPSSTTTRYSPTPSSGPRFRAARRDAALLLAAVLSSSLASWFFLLTGSTFGLWMQRIKRRDIEHLPVPDLDVSLRSDAGRRLTQLAVTCDASPPTGPADPRWRTLDEAVFELYGLDDAERTIVRDGRFRASWQWKDGRERFR